MPRFPNPNTNLLHIMLTKPVHTALISVFHKEGLAPVVEKLHELGVTLYSTGGTYAFIRDLGIACKSVESLTGYPSILGGRVKTLHPKVFGGILGRRSLETDRKQMLEYEIPGFDLVIVDLYPFAETLRRTRDEAEIIEKIDIGGVSLLRAAAKNYKEVAVISDKSQYGELRQLLESGTGGLREEQRKKWAAAAFARTTEYDRQISDYFQAEVSNSLSSAPGASVRALRYGENPHQKAWFYGDTESLFTQIHGKALSYNNLVDLDAAMNLAREFEDGILAIIKHTNVCGIARRSDALEAWKLALAGDPESAFGGVIICQHPVEETLAREINPHFFEVLMAPSFSDSALEILRQKKNRILLVQKSADPSREDRRSLLGGTLVQEKDLGSLEKWGSKGGRRPSQAEEDDLRFANLVCKHLKSNAIALVRGQQLLGKGCGQTSRIDALRQSIAKAEQNGVDLKGAVMASDAFFPFDDCARLAHEAGISAIIQPGGSIRDEDTISFCRDQGMALIMSGMRHFKH